MAELTTLMSDLKKENNSLRDSLDGYEIRQRCLNLCVMGIGEDSEWEQCPLKFMSELLVKVLDDESISKPPELERCHRAVMPKLTPNACPRPFIVCFHRFQERERVLQLARKRHQLVYEGKKIFFFRI